MLVELALDVYIDVYASMAYGGSLPSSPIHPVLASALQTLARLAFGLAYAYLRRSPFIDRKVSRPRLAVGRVDSSRDVTIVRRRQARFLWKLYLIVFGSQRKLSRDLVRWE